MPFLLKLGKDYNVTVGYRIYSIYRPGRLKIFEPGEWALIQGGRSINFHHFQQV